MTLPMEKNLMQKNNDVLHLAAELNNLEQVLAFVDGYLEAADCSMKTQMQIEVAVEEIYVNIAHYAYKTGTGDAYITVRIEEDPKTVEIEFRDTGMPFDPTANPDPDVTLSAEKRKIGGLGIFMVKKSMDDIQYRRENGCNILKIRKKL